MAHYIVFSALAVLLFVCMSLTELKGLFIILFLLWLLRMVFLKKIRLLILTFILVFLMGIRLYNYQNTAQTVLLGEETTFVIEVDRLTVTVDGDRLQFYGRIKTTDRQSSEIDEKIVVFYRIQSEEEKKHFLQEDLPELMLVQGVLEEAESRRNFAAFDYRNFLKNQQIYWTLEANSLTAMQRPSSIFHPKEWRYQVLTWVEKYLPNKSAAYINMLLFSDKRQLSGDMQAHYKDLGVIHLLSISGMHITFFITMLRYLLLRLGIVRERLPLILLIMLPLYGILTAWGNSAFRAITQHCLKAIGELNDWPFDTLDYWAITLIMALFLNPNQIHSVGFQFSYTLSFCLYMLQDMPYLNKWPTYLKKVAISALLTLVSLPILTYHYFEVPYYGVIVNSLLTPFFMYFLLLGALICLFIAILPLGPISNFVFSFYESGISIFERVVKGLGQWPNLTFISGRLPHLAMAGLVIALLCFISEITAKQVKRRRLFLSLCVIACTLFSHRLNPTAQLMMIDVGQGDAMVYKEPFMRTITLIDTGGQLPFEEETWKRQENPYHLGEKVVIPALKAQGIARIDHTIITHADWDHVGEIERIIAAIPVHQIVLTEQAMIDLQSAPDLFLAIQANPHQLLAENSMSQLSNGLYLLAPEANQQSKNDSSLIVYGKLGDDMWLFTGDMEERAEQAFVKRFPNLEVDVLKIAHHGSNTSTTEAFLEHYQPREALLSVGKNNWYGHPHSDVITRIVDRHIRLYRTDLQGAIKFSYKWLPKQKIIETVLKEE